MTTSTDQTAATSSIAERMQRREAVRQALPGGGALRMDPGLPYLLVYRDPPDREDRGTERLLAGEASYMRPGAEDDGAAGLVADVGEAAAEVYGAFLVIEVWSSPDPDSRTFRLFGPVGAPAAETVEKLTEGLRAISELRLDTEVEVADSDARHPPDLPPLLSVHESWESGVLLLGLEVPPIYRDPQTGALYPRFLRRLRRSLSRALRQATYEFIRVQTTCDVPDYRALGTRSVPDAAWEMDRALVAIERSFDILLLTSAVNEREAWERFRRDRCERPPEFRYRLLPLDPDLLKRRLFALRLEEIDDPAMADLFYDKREELDRLLGMIAERGTPAFRYGSMSLYRTVDSDLLRTARELLARIPGTPAAGAVAASGRVGAREFKALADEELAHYARTHPETTTRKVVVRPDLVGLMVSEGNLLIGERLSLSRTRVRALLQHEVGTHVLTYVNGSAQPLEQLSLGLAGYDELQEGMAVLSEYLVGGLDRFRMRLLAARVVAAHSVEQGADFVETFRLLAREHGFPPETAWRVTVRVHACGGFTRDLIYLRGLVRLLEYLSSGGDLAPLYIGKMAQKHIPLIEELRFRGVLREPPLTPRFLDDAAALRQLDRVRRGISLPELIGSD